MTFNKEPLVLHSTDGKPDFTYSQVRLQKTDKSKNGYYVWINGVCVLTHGPVLADKDGYHVDVTVTLRVRAEDLIED